MNELESPFDLHEIFYSKTDKKGIIQSGNSVFVRVSEFPEEELLKKPHNIIRHQDMPRAVFKLFWNFLRNGDPIAAYVKNKSKLGRFYWVFAMAFPMDDGFLSIRLKPTSSFLSTVQKIYSDVLSREDSGLSMENGIEFIQQNLLNHGFSSYAEFMKNALIEELLSRDQLLSTSDINPKRKSLNHPLDNFSLLCDSCAVTARKSFTETRRLFDKVDALIRDSQVVIKTCEKVKYVTLNLTVASAKLGEAGRPLSVVSSNLEKLTNEIALGSDQFEAIFNSYEKSIFDMYFYIAISRFQIEMMKHLTDEVLEDCGNTNHCTKNQERSLASKVALLLELISNNFGKVASTSANLMQTNKSLSTALENLSKITAGMGVIHVVGKIEMARTGSNSESLSWRLNEMAQLMEVFKTTLSNLEKESSLGMTDCVEINRINENLAQDFVKIDRLIGEMSHA